jgi:rod shape-determining protein MreD
MIMRQGQQLLLPVNPLFIWSSLFGGFLLNLLFNIAIWGRAAWAPDFLALALVFWGVHQPQRMGMGVAFVFGLLMDVHQGSVLGQHALAYSVLSFLAISIHRRLLWFTVPSQSLQMLPLMAAAHGVEMIVRLAMGGNAPSWVIVFAPIIEALLWPLATIVLLMPQRRAPDPDVDRPI